MCAPNLCPGSSTPGRRGPVDTRFGPHLAAALSQVFARGSKSLGVLGASDASVLNTVRILKSPIPRLILSTGF